MTTALEDPKVGNQEPKKNETKKPSKTSASAILPPSPVADTSPNSPPKREISHLEQVLRRSPKNEALFEEERLLLDVGLLINKRLKALGMAKKELAKKLKTTKKKVNQWICGDRDIQIRELSDIFLALDCAIHVTFGDTTLTRLGKMNDPAIDALRSQMEEHGPLAG